MAPDDDRRRVCPRCEAEVSFSARYCPSCGEGLPGPIAEAPPVPDEIRLVTAVFADIVGSTSLGERLTGHDAKTLVGECVTRMSRVIEEFGGTVQAYMGDGICAYFGVPVAHEDDYQRAAEAALRILEVVDEYSRDIEYAWGVSGFNVRIGINSGRTGVGSVGAANPQTVALGDAMNVAARLQAAADPGTILVGEGISKQLVDGFIMTPLGELRVKGRSGPVSAWRLEGSDKKREPTRARPLIDRKMEIRILRVVTADLMVGRGQILMLTGESGIGKTRLVYELRTMVGEGATWLEGLCHSYGPTAMLSPFVEILRNWLGAQEGDAEIAIRTRLRSKVGSLPGEQSQSHIVPFLARLLSLKLGPEEEELMRELPATTLAERTRAAYSSWIQSLTQERPVVVAIDGLHLADTSVLDLAEELLPLTDRAPLLLAFSLRPDRTSDGWRFHSRVLTDFGHRAAEVRLERLADDAAAELLTELAAPTILDEVTQRNIVERAEGNPLYIEQLVHAIGELSEVDRGMTWTLTASHSPQLPPALEGVLVARIDRLPGDVRFVAQIASVLGRTFQRRLLERILNDDAEMAMTTLLRAEIIIEFRRYPEVEYGFKHGLIREAALSTLTLERQRELSGRIGRAIEDLHADSLEEHLEPLAYFYYRSNDAAKALEYLERAAADATIRNDPPKATDLLRRALKVARRLNDEGIVQRVTASLDQIQQRNLS